MTLSQLIAAVERAEGASRELDAAIFRAIGAPLPSEFAGKSLALTFDEARSAFFMPMGEMVVRYEPPAYTASLDAAMTLVGDNHWRVEDHPMAGPCALVNDHEGYAATPALALCAAALRAHEARAAMEGR